MKDSFYFSHDANARHDEKILLLRSVFAWEGYGLYWAIIETMREAPEYRLNLAAMAGLSVGLGVDISRLQQLVEYAIEIELFRTDGAAYWSDSLLRRMEAWDARRMSLSAAGRRGASNRWKLHEKRTLGSDVIATPLATPIAIREEKRREEKSNTPPAPPSGGGVRNRPTARELIEAIQLPVELDTPDFRRAWEEWIVHRRSLQKPREWLVFFARQLKTLAAHGHAVALATIQQSTVNGWVGLFPEKHHKPPEDHRGATHSRSDPSAERRRLTGDDFQQQWQRDVAIAQRVVDSARDGKP